MRTDQEARKVLTRDLSAYITPEIFKPMRFELAPKSRTVTLRVPEQLLGALKTLAEKRHLPYQRMIRVALEEYLHRVA
jgi:predicted DNA binding CopG/RHH family protein